MTSKWLEHIYEKLELKQGELLSATENPIESTMDSWVEKGGWLSLAAKIGQNLPDVKIDKVFFVHNDPVIVFAECSSNEKAIGELFRRVWCMARPSFLFVATPGELHVYSLSKLPERNKEGIQAPLSLIILHRIDEVLEQLSMFHREQLETGLLFADKRFGDIAERADRRFISDLKVLRYELIQEGLKEDKLMYAHAIIGRSIFIRYLEDRKILTKEYYYKIAEKNARWTELLNDPLPGFEAQADMQSIFYLKVLRDKQFTYALYENLSKDFNGDTFPQDPNEKENVKQTHLDLLQRFLRGDTGSQQKLFFWAYKFDIIPTELISNLYEEFYRKVTKGKETGTHYTPLALVEYVLSQVLTPSKLEKNPRILDPACGSGIFLVESFRRIVRYRVRERAGAALSYDELRAILKNQIAGIERNGEAIRVAAFSLYLALLHYQEPPDILEWVRSGQRLPNLKYQNKQGERYFNILYESDTFDSLQEWTGNEEPLFDVIVGNPPWGEAEEKAIKWCNSNQRPIGDKEYSQAFIWRIMSLLQQNATAGLLVSSGVLLKQHPKSKRFRQIWLSEAKVNQVVNFIHARKVFFANAIAPFAYIEFEKTKDIPPDHTITYWSAKRTAAVAQQQAVILSSVDRKLVHQREAIVDDRVWKIYWWGSHRDRALINRISLNQTLGDLIETRKWKAGVGYKRGGAKCKQYPSDWLLKYRELPVQHLSRYGKFPTDCLISVPDEVHRKANEKLYKGWRILFKQGVSQALGVNGRILVRLEKEDCCFTHAMYGINVDNAEDWERKTIIAVLWSSLARYYYFLTASQWGTWHDSIFVEVLLSIPIKFPNNEELKNRVLKVVNELQECDQEILHNCREAELEQELDQVVFDLYGLNHAERDLIHDLCNTEMDFFYNHSESLVIKALDYFPKQTIGVIKDVKEKNYQRGLEGYLTTFLGIWNQELEPDGEFNWQIFGLHNSAAMIAVVFTTQYKGGGLTPIALHDEDSILAKLKNRLLIPFNSSKVYVDGIVRVVADDHIIIIKRNETRLWTRSRAREDAEATILQAMALQDAYQRGEK